eukprot:5322231-Amphidinium_carterae.1
MQSPCEGRADRPTAIHQSACQRRGSIGVAGKGQHMHNAERAEFQNLVIPNMKDSAKCRSQTLPCRACAPRVLSKTFLVMLFLQHSTTRRTVWHGT